jgi:hypothetical protein
MLVPIIQYSSMFVKTSNLTQFYSNQEMHSEAALFSQLDLGEIYNSIKTKCF